LRAGRGAREPLRRTRGQGRGRRSDRALRPVPRAQREQLAGIQQPRLCPFSEGQVLRGTARPDVGFRDSTGSAAGKADPRTTERAEAPPACNDGGSPIGAVRAAATNPARHARRHAAAVLVMLCAAWGTPSQSVAVEFDPIGTWNCLVYGPYADQRMFLALTEDRRVYIARIRDASERRWVPLSD